MTLSYLAVGSNLGDRLHYISQARQLLEKNPAIHFLRTSAIHETEPVGGPVQGKYLNAVWEIETSLTPQELLKTLLEIEASLGRIRDQVNGPRTMDLDILFYGNQILDEPKLHIPHPRLFNRSFVLKPLMELCPDFVHPKLQKTVSELWREYKDFYAVSPA